MKRLFTHLVIGVFALVFFGSCAGKAFYQNQLNEVGLIANQYTGEKHFNTY